MSKRPGSSHLQDPGMGGPASGPGSGDPASGAGMGGPESGAATGRAHGIPSHPGLAGPPSRRRSSPGHTLVEDDHSVSAVISAVLLFALFSTAFLLWSLNTLPEWVADREHDHALAVAGGMSRLAAELDAVPVGEQASLGTDLAPRKVPLLQTSTARGSIAFEEGFTWAAQFEGERAFVTGGAVVAQPAGLPSEPAVAAIRALELTFTGPGTAPPGQFQPAYVEVTGYVDADGDGIVDAGESSVQIRLGMRSATVCSSNIEAYIETRSGQGANPPVVTTHIVACAPSLDASIAADAMQEQHRFKGLLGRLGDDFSVTGQSVGTGSGEAAMVWHDLDGQTQISGTGIDMALDTVMEGGRVALQVDYQEFVPRTVAFEGGGVINIEEDGSAFVQGPTFVLGKDGVQGFLRWRIVDMGGTGSLSGQDGATLRVTKTGTSETVLSADSASFTLDTAAPGAWKQLWNDARLVAGLDAADISVSTTDETATLNLDPSLAWTIQLTIVHVEVSIT